MTDIRRIENGLLDKLLEFPGMGEGAVVIADIDGLLQYLSETGNRVGAILDYGGWSDRPRKTFNGAKGVWRVDLLIILIMDANEDMDAELREILMALRNTFAVPVRLGGSPLVYLIGVDAHEPGMVLDRPAYLLGAYFEAIDV